MTSTSLGFKVPHPIVKGGRVRQAEMCPLGDSEKAIPCLPRGKPKWAKPLNSGRQPPVATWANPPEVQRTNSESQLKLYQVRQSRPLTPVVQAEFLAYSGAAVFAVQRAHLVSGLQSPLLAARQGSLPGFGKEARDSLEGSHTVDGCEIRSHHFETMGNQNVCWYLQGNHHARVS